MNVENLGTVLALRLQSQSVIGNGSDKALIVVDCTSFPYMRCMPVSKPHISYAYEVQVRMLCDVFAVELHRGYAKLHSCKILIFHNPHE